MFYLEIATWSFGKGKAWEFGAMGSCIKSLSEVSETEIVLRSMLTLLANAQEAKIKCKLESCSLLKQ